MDDAAPLMHVDWIRWFQALANKVNAPIPTLNQNTTGSAGSLSPGRNINGVLFDGTADITVTAAAGTLTGATLNATVLASSLTSVGILTGGATGAGFTIALSTSTVTGLLALVRGGLGFDASGIAKGGVFAGTGAGTVGITTVGADGTALTADAASAGGVKWATVGTVTGSGTTGKIAKWSSASALTDGPTASDVALLSASNVFLAQQVINAAATPYAIKLTRSDIAGGQGVFIGASTTTTTPSGALFNNAGTAALTWADNLDVTVGRVLFAVTGLSIASAAFVVDSLGNLNSTVNIFCTGTLGCTGNFAVNTSKFTVAASTGNTVVAGTLNVTGTITGTGTVAGNVGSFTQLSVGASGSALLGTTNTAALQITAVTPEFKFIRTTGAAGSVVGGLTWQDSTTANVLGFHSNFTVGSVWEWNFFTGGAWANRMALDTAGVLTLTSPVKLKGYTVATLPAGVVGYIAYATDLLAPTFLTAATGGGAVTGPVFYNGAAWTTI